MKRFFKKLSIIVFVILCIIAYGYIDDNLLATEPVTKIYVLENSEIKSDKITSTGSGGRKKGKKIKSKRSEEVKEGTPYVQIYLTSDENETLSFKSNRVKKWNWGNGIEPKTPYSIQHRLQKTKSIEVTHRRTGLSDILIIDEVTCHF